MGIRTQLSHIIKSNRTWSDAFASLKCLEATSPDYELKDTVVGLHTNPRLTDIGNKVYSFSKIHNVFTDTAEVLFDSCFTDDHQVVARCIQIQKILISCTYETSISLKLHEEKQNK